MSHFGLWSTSWLLCSGNIQLCLIKPIIKTTATTAKAVATTTTTTTTTANPYLAQKINTPPTTNHLFESHWCPCRRTYSMAISRMPACSFSALHLKPCSRTGEQHSPNPPPPPPHTHTHTHTLTMRKYCKPVHVSLQSSELLDTWRRLQLKWIRSLVWMAVWQITSWKLQMRWASSSTEELSPDPEICETFSINYKFPLQLHHKYNITQYEELDFSWLTQMKDDCTTKFSLHHLYIYL